MTDAFFKGTVVLLWEHSEEGAIGFVINRPLEANLAEILVSGDHMDLSHYATTQVCWGGPVEAETASVITTHPVDDDNGWEIAPGIFLTRSQEALEAAVAAHAPLLFVLGYAGWGQGQLDAEFAQGDWISGEVREDLLFSVPHDQRYAAALAAIGIQSAAFWGGPAEA